MSRSYKMDFRGELIKLWVSFIFGPDWFYVIDHSVVIRRFIKYSVFVYRLFINSFIAENTPFDDNLLLSLSLFLLFGAREKESLFLTPGAQEEDSKRDWLDCQSLKKRGS